MKLADRLYQEVDDSCALCGIRGIGLLSIHHIDGDHANNVYENTIILCHNCHKRFHDGMGITATDIRDRKRHLIHKTLTAYGLNALKIAGRNDLGVVAIPFLLHHVVELGYMAQNEPIMFYHADGMVNFNPDDDDSDSGEAIHTDGLARFSITASGRTMLSNWFG